jgi:solute:Na+ symporter, SSS family
VLLSGGSILSHNLIVPLRPGLPEAGRICAARDCVIVLVLVAFAIALRSATIHELVETATSIGSAGLIVVALLGLFTRFGGPGAAMAALVTGGAAWLAAFAFTSVPYVLAVALAALANVLAGLFPLAPRG